jgi:glycosyltransferase involved in cell wall biosynthesis
VSGNDVVVVGINYAPEPTGIAPYTTQMAEHLALSARSVTVLTGVPHYPTWRVPVDYRWRLRVSDPPPSAGPGNLVVRRLRHYVPRKQTAARRATYEATFLAQACATRVAAAPSVVVAVTPSLGGAVAGVRLARRHGSKLVVVVQDLMAKAASQSGIKGGGRVSSATGALEAFALRRADRVLIVSESFRSQLLEFGVSDSKIRLWPNWAHISPSDLDRVEARRSLGWAEDAFTIVHTGNMGLKQNLGNVVEAARMLAGEPDLRFVFVGDGSQRREIEAQAKGLANVYFVDPLTHDEYPKSLAAADLLVLNEKPGVSEMSLPSKLTSYLSAGRPVVAAVEPDGASAVELARTGGSALRVDPGRPEALAAAVRELRNDLPRCGVMGRAGREYCATQLGRAAATRSLDVIMDELLSER